MGKKKAKSVELRDYSRFRKICGVHPLQENCPESVVLYQVRLRHGGQVAYFNFDMAREIGLIAKDHEDQLNPDLEQQILESFGLVIINEYDQLNDRTFPKEDILPHKYMATRYLQLQHPNKQGKTSGDGRSIWNGFFSSRGKSFDVSSCGTGATRLSPATHINQKFYETGDPTISYGCGYSEIDEGLSTLFFSEVFHQNSYKTERVLAIIEYPKGIAINVRVHENLIRPSHMFNHLKQRNLQALRPIVNYYIDRQEKNGTWTDVPKSQDKRYDYFLEKQCLVFSELAANFEDDYVFCWLDWDGDNILMDGGIIDYGSIRQFGLFHHEYRFDDEHRYSTTIKEQKEKARYIVQTFCQIVEFLKTKKCPEIKSVRRHKILRKFNKNFDHRKNFNLLKKVGMPIALIDPFLKDNRSLVERFRRDFSYFERAKSQEGIYEVADGINWNAIFCMRDILRELPQLLLSRGKFLNAEEFIDIARSSYAEKKDLEISVYRARKVHSFQKNYREIIKRMGSINHKSLDENLLEITVRSSIINKYDRVTGDSITIIVDKVLRERPKVRGESLHQILREFVEHQNFDPDTKRNFDPHQKEKSKLVKSMLNIVRTHREGI